MQARTNAAIAVSVSDFRRFKIENSSCIWAAIDVRMPYAARSVISFYSLGIVTFAGVILDPSTCRGLKTMPVVTAIFYISAYIMYSYTSSAPLSNVFINILYQNVN